MSEQTEELVALNADIVGYSRLLADDREATTSRVEEYSKLVAQRVADSQGTLVNFVGDNFMAVFPTAEEAVQAAISISSEIESHNESLPSSRWVRFRMGMDQGETTVHDGDYAGDALNVAARIQAMARPGGLSVSGRVYRALDEPSLRFRPLGRKSLKNIPEPVEVYEFADLPSGAVPGQHRRSLHLEAPTLSVLPSDTEGVDEQTAAAARLLRQDLVHRLASIPGLKVIDAAAESSAGNEAVARYTITPGLHQVGNTVRVFAPLVDLTTFIAVKTHKWTVPADELLSRSEELANEVGRTVEVELIVGQPAGIYSELLDDESIEKVYRGWHLLIAENKLDWQQAVRLFGEVAEAHPEVPVGHTLSAFSNWLAAANEWGDPERLLDLAAEQADAAIAIGDLTGLGRMVRAAVLTSRGRPAEALTEIESAEILRPTCDITYGVEGSVRRYMGQWEKAVDLTDLAMRLTAVNKPWYPTVQSCSLLMGERYEQAAELAELVLEHHPQNLEALLVLAMAQVEMGQERRAKATGQAIKERFPAVDVAGWLERNPYQDRDLVERWKKDLAIAGAIDG
ncbi:MAG: tetratricopeptide repeat protein [Actinobacteria bacterium]|nr:tetratricopeptide repeat protein [Actinomycetota bacterium]